MNRGKLYGVGVGPGDPKLLTLAAVEAIGRCPVVALPDAGGGEPLALQIARQYVRGKELVRLDMPMTRDRALMEQKHRAAFAAVARRLDRGEDVAFLTLGDPSIYSTYLYLHRLALEAGYGAEMVPGVTSFCAAAAALGTGLCEGAQPLHIIPGSYRGAEQSLDLEGTKVLMKSGSQGESLLGALDRRGELEQASLVERCGLEGERIVHRPRPEEQTGYFTTIIVKEG